MTSEDPDRQLIFGLTVSLLALVETLDKKGVISAEDYRATVARLWDEMPEADMTTARRSFLRNYFVISTRWFAGSEIHNIAGKLPDRMTFSFVGTLLPLTPP